MDAPAPEESTTSAAAAADDRFPPGADDVVIVPLVACGFAVARILRAAFTALIRFLDYAFPILLQVMRFPLFTLRILGDGLVWLSKGIIRCLPVALARRRLWVERLGAGWAWLRARISYAAFEEAVHHLFENGMAWVFRRCRTLTPRAALLVIGAAALWLPISFSIATAMHALLIAYAASLPPWMQLLHPFATLIAKSKLLVLPVYPAAWPQARRHPFVVALFDVYHACTRLYLVRKTGYRYRQTALVAAHGTEALARSRMAAVLARWWGVVSPRLRGAAAWLRRVAGSIARGTLRALARLPLIGAAVVRYAEHYDEAGLPALRLSEQMHGLYDRWSIKFTARYYEEKDQAANAARVPVARA
jgi:hypothetical protein